METMTKKFVDRLTEFLNNECSDYDLEYTWEWCEDTQSCEVVVSRNDEKAYVNFKYVENNLQIELCEDSWYTIEEYEPTVKYFWMLISPKLFN